MSTKTGQAQWHIAIELGAQRQGAQLEYWLDELALKRAQKAAGGMNVHASALPDGHFVQRYRGNAHISFLK